MQAEEEGGKQLPPLGEVASHGAACGVRWRRLPRLTEAQIREQLLLEEKRKERKVAKRESRCPLHARLDGRLVPACPTLSPYPAGPSLSSAPAANAVARLDRVHAAVIDDFVSESARAELLSLVVFGGNGGGEEGDGSGSEGKSYDELSGSGGLPRPRWERRTADSAEAANAAAADEGEEEEEEEEEEEGNDAGTEKAHPRRRLGWGLSSRAIDDLLALASSSPPPSPSPSPTHSPPSPPPRALAEVGSKLSAMFPGHDCLWLPTESMEGNGRRGGGGAEEEEEEKDKGGDDDESFSSTSPPLLANAASSLDVFSYHSDCDPDSTQEGTPWHRAFGHYVNGDPKRPLLVSVVLYLNELWSPSFAGETLVIDSTAAVGCAVLPRPRRALLLESDVMHKVCPPAAVNRLRFSLVFKLALCPKKIKKERNSSSEENVNVLSRAWWGPAADLGSAKALAELVRRVGEEKKDKRERGGGEEEAEVEGSGKQKRAN